jgi:hypothetical protein
MAAANDGSGVDDGGPVAGPSRRHSRRGRLLAGFCAVVATVVVVRAAIPNPLGAERFSKSAWADPRWAPSGKCSRYAMILDLVRTHHLLGMRRDEVHALLGAPDRETVIAEGEWRDEWNIGGAQGPLAFLRPPIPFSVFVSTDLRVAGYNHPGGRVGDWR